MSQSLGRRRGAGMVALLLSMILWGCGQRVPKPSAANDPVAPVLATSQQPQKKAAKKMNEQRWLASIDIPMQPLQIVVTFRFKGDRALATLAIPNKKIQGIPLAKVVYSDTRIRFVLEKPGAPKALWESYQAARKGDEATGTMTINQQSFPLRMERLKKGQKPTPLADRRPQTPKPPFPYLQREARFKSVADGTQFAGTLTLPKGGKKVPAVVLISGSGAQDRNCDIVGHKYFLVIADYLTRQGIAVLRFDDRGVGGSGGSNAAASMEDKAGDALGALQWLKQQPEINQEQMGLLGHSEGGLVAPLAASKSQEVAFVIALAGPAVRGDQIMYTQKALVLKAMGVPPAIIEQKLKVQRQLLDAAVAKSDDATLRKAIADAVDRELAIDGASDKVSATMRKGLIERAFQMIGSKSGRSFIRSNPAATLKKIQQPILLLWGELDTQVAADENLVAAKKALASGGNKHAVLAKIPKANHAFQPAKTGSPSEYQTIAETIAPKVLALLGEYVLCPPGKAKSCMTPKPFVYFEF